MTEHDHERAVAMFGECPTCVVRSVTGREDVTVEYSGRALAQEGIDRADRAAPNDWRALARQTLRLIAESRPTVVGDDLWEQIDAPAEPRAAGAVFQWARRAGLIEPTDEFVPARRPQAHAAPSRVWRSLVYAG